MEPKPSEGDSAKVVARATKMVHVATTRKHALNRTDVASLFQDCFSPEASNGLKILGFRLGCLAPSCMSPDLWAMLLDAVVKELAGATTQGSTQTLIHAIPVFDVLPAINVLGFLMQGDAEQLKKIQACVAHESTVVRQAALSTFSRVSILCTKVLFARGLSRFPFESHEARIVAQQDVASVLHDVWKMHLHAAEAEGSAVAGAAFANLAHLFARSLAVQRAAHLDLDLNPAREERGVDELVALVFQMAAPRFEFLRANAEKLSLEAQLDAMRFLSMLAFLMMQRSGAATPGLAIAIVDVDAGGDDDDKPVKVRVDLVVADMVDSWLLPAFSNASLVQAYEIAQGISVILAHPLLAHARLKWAPLLLARLAAMTQAVSAAAIASSARDREHMLRLQISLLQHTNTYNCLQALSPTMTAIAAIDAPAHRQQFFLDVWRAIVPRLSRASQLPLLEGICRSPLFHGCPFLFLGSGAKGGGSTPSAQTSFELFRALVECLLGTPGTLSAQWHVLKQFAPMLSSKADADARHAALLLYTGLLTHACGQSAGDLPTVATFLHTVIEPLAFKALPYPNVRVQLYWLCFRFLPKHATDTFLGWIATELDALAASKDAVAPPAAAYSNDGLLGHPPEPPRRPLASHDLGRFAALVLSLRALLAREPALGQEVLQLLSHARDRHATHRVVCAEIDSAVEEITGLTGDTPAPKLQALPLCLLPDLFSVHALFPRQSPGRPAANARSDDIGDVVVSGPCDPLCLKISFREPSEAPELVALGITCVNASSVPFGNVTIVVGSAGPVRPVDAATNTPVRIAGDLPPYASIKSEKVFQCAHFTRARFVFRVFYDGDAPLRMGATSVYEMPLEALLQAPCARDTTAGGFLAAWQAADANRVYSVQSVARPSVHELLDVHAKVAALDALNLISAGFAQFHFLTMTKWRESVAVVLSVAQATDDWQGTLEVRGPAAVVAEIDASSLELLRLVSVTLTIVEATPAEKVPLARSPRHGKTIKEPLSPTAKDQVREGTPTTTRRTLMSFFGGKA
ncbi:hypothetical protein ACHHYP_09450 [Achlya hypogyna]|uniref:Uncharacterized protein n=1 Tax=Achlya hypogyna TaxID=1202772 RepID=A0A1V9ZIW4_ACHHY|nr:hypothetical protein ACHHYP_09450 [Achlya hypogyna]